MPTNPTFEQAKAAIFATGTIPDGCNGNMRDVGFAYSPDHNHDGDWILAVWEHGYFPFLRLSDSTKGHEGRAGDALATYRPKIANLTPMLDWHNLPKPVGCAPSLAHQVATLAKLA